MPPTHFVISKLRFILHFMIVVGMLRTKDSWQLFEFVCGKFIKLELVRSGVAYVSISCLIVFQLHQIILSPVFLSCFPSVSMKNLFSSCHQPLLE